MYIGNSARPAKLQNGKVPASAFTVHTGRAISGMNNKSVYGVADREACKKLCLTETAFTCNSADYIISTRGCLMSTYK